MHIFGNASISALVSEWDQSLAHYNAHRSPGAALRCHLTYGPVTSGQWRFRAVFSQGQSYEAICPGSVAETRLQTLANLLADLIAAGPAALVAHSHST